jgi:hypothetical protein
MSKIIGQGDLGTTATGWSKITDIINPSTGNRELVYRGAYATRAEAVTEIASSWAKENYKIEPYGGSPSVMAYRVTLSPTSADIPTPAGDVRAPRYSVTPVETDIPIEALDNIPTFLPSDQKYIAPLTALIRKGDMKEVNAYVAKFPDSYKAAYWLLSGVKTIKSHGYNLSVTRYVRIGGTGYNAVYNGVWTVLDWAGVTTNLTVINSGIPEPKVKGTSLKWLVCPPSVDRMDRWIQVQQNYLGALRYPDLYQGGSWVPDAGMFPVPLEPTQQQGGA